MSLLPFGERGPRVPQLVFALLVITLGYQGFLYFHRSSAVEGNIVSLGDLLSTGNADRYRQQLAQILETNGVAVDPEAIVITYDRERDAFDVVVPCRWTLSLPWKQVELEHTFKGTVAHRAGLDGA